MERIPAFLDGLNHGQMHVATTISGPVLRIVGPSSGKTKTLVNRVVYLLYSGIKPEEIMVATQYTSEIASASMMSYRMIKSSEASKGIPA